MYDPVTGRMIADTKPHFNKAGKETVSTIKATLGHLYFLEIENKNLDDAWIQFFDESGAITVGTTTPKLSILVPSGDGTVYGSKVLSFSKPLGFANSIKYACTKGVDDNVSPGSDLIVNAVSE